MSDLDGNGARSPVLGGAGKGVWVGRVAPVVALVLGLAACGGGGNSPSSPNPPPAVAPPSPPPPPQPPPPAHDPPAVDVHLAPTGVYVAQAKGLDGSGVRVAVVDSGVNRAHPTLQGRVVANQVYLGPGNDLTVDDAIGHGTWVSQILAGTAFGQWPGGVAPGAQIVSARIISDAPPSDDGSGRGNEITGTGTGEFFGYLHGNLMSAGARIMNNSWGGLYWNSDTVTRSFHDAYAPYVMQYGGLVVFSTGNAAMAGPSDTAALPSKSALTAELERGWLAVAALDSNNLGALASYSNACGVAMDYCLVAPGRVVVTGHEDTAQDPSYWVVAGTSLAAPQVSGAAALVWQAFPYFDNDLVRQTLLGTATDLGAPGPDPVFGYGLLNVGKATAGPGRFDWGDVVVAFSGASRWSNGIEGEGGLVKRGPGTLWLGRDDDFVVNHGYGGDTRVEAGSLVLQRAFLSESATHVSSGAALNLLNGRVKSVDNAGEVNVLEGNNVVFGDLRQRASSSLGVMVGASLWVGGQMHIEGGSFDVLGRVQGYTSSSRERVVTAEGGIQGEFDQLRVAEGVLFEGRLRYQPTFLELEINRLDVSAAGLSLNAAGLGSAKRLDAAFAQLDRWLLDGGAIDPGASAFLEGAGRFQQASTSELAAASVHSLSGEIHATQLSAVLKSLDVGSAALSRRVLDRFENPADPFAPAVWVQDLAYAGELSGDGSSQAQVSFGGRVVGADRLLGGSLLAGISLTKARLDAGLGGLAGNSQSLVDEAGLYAGTLFGPVYAQGRVSVGRLNQRMERHVLLGGDLAGVASRYRAHYEAADLEAGRPFVFDAVRITPFVSSQWVSIDSDGFAEEGAWGFGLEAGDAVHQVWRAGAGVDLSRAWESARGRAFSLSARVQWQRTLDASDAFRAGFTGLSGALPIAGIDVPERRTAIGVTLDSQLSPSTRLELGAHQEFSAQGRDPRASAVLRVGF